MPVEEACSPPRGGGCGEESRAEEPTQAVYLVPVYAVAIVDPNELSESVLAPNFGDEAAGPELAVEQKRQKLVTRKRGAILEYDDDDPHKPTPKRLRNRMKSQKSRDKKKAYINALESKVKELEKMISELEKRCLILQNENEALKNEALETDPGVEEKLMLYYQKLQKKKENTAKSPENEEDPPANSGGSEEEFLEKCAEVMGQEHTPEIDVGELMPVTQIKVTCAEVAGLECSAVKFAEADDPACTSEMIALESSPLKFDSASSQERTLRCTKITNNNILIVEDCVEQHSVTRRSNPSQ